MTLTVLVASLLALVGIESVCTWRDLHRDRTVKRAARAAAPIVTHADAECAMTRQLLGGRLKPADYRDAMAALAATEEQVTGVDPLRLIAMDDDSLEQLRQLAIAMPALPRATLAAAVALTRNGATVEHLIRLLGLTNAQSVRVIITIMPHAA